MRGARPRLPDEAITTKSAFYYRARKDAPKAAACQTCNGRRNLDLHHIDCNPRNNDPANVMTLCRSCHRKWHWQHTPEIHHHRVRGTCSICDRPHACRGMCDLHYRRWKRHGDPLRGERKEGEA